MKDTVNSEFEQKLEVDRAKIKNAVRLQTPIEITSYTLPRNMEVYIRNVLTTFLEECHQEHLEEYLAFCLNELLTNAKKANTKRVYFKEKGLDINKPDDYESGMEHFKEDTLTNIDHYLELQKKEGLYIKIDMQLRGDKVKIEIKNKATLTVFEEERIQKKLDTVKKYDSMEEVITEVIDQTEGAGLGIIIIVLMLQKVGLAKENFQIESKDGETVTRIILPCNQKYFAAEEMMTYEFINLQNTIPVMKSNLEAIKPLLEAEKILRGDLLTEIRNDPTLSLLLIKTAIKKDKDCVELNKAMELLTDDEIRAVYNVSEDDVHFVEENDEQKNLWKHAKNTAFFAYNLAKNNDSLAEKYNAERLYSAGLLNSLSLILLESATENQKEFMREMGNQYGESGEKIIEIFLSGNVHSYMNLIYSKRIGLPEKFTAVISTWNYWEMAPDAILDAIYTVYISEMLQHYLERKIDFYQVDKIALKYFNINTESQFCMLAKKLSQAVG